VSESETFTHWYFFDNYGYRLTFYGGNEQSILTRFCGSSYLKCFCAF
jgi:hypothetical protein